MRSVAERLPANFKLVFSSSHEEARLQLSGPINTQDELDAVVEALAVMRDWLNPAASGMEAQRAETGTGSVHDSPTAESGDAQ